MGESVRFIVAGHISVEVGGDTREERVKNAISAVLDDNEDITEDMLVVSDE